MKNEKHVSDLMTDYLLGLATNDEASYIQAHIVDCYKCRLELWKKRQIGADVWNVHASISVPDEKQLDKLMPTIPRLEAGWQGSRNLKAGLALASFIIIVTFTSIGVRASLAKNSWLTTSQPTYSTALVTDTPTQSLIATPSSDLSIGIMEITPEPHKTTNSPHPAMIPVPVATFLN